MDSIKKIDLTALVSKISDSGNLQIYSFRGYPRKLIQLQILVETSAATTVVITLSTLGRAQFTKSQESSWGQGIINIPALDELEHIYVNSADARVAIISVVGFSLSEDVSESYLTSELEIRSTKKLEWNSGGMIIPGNSQVHIWPKNNYGQEAIYVEQISANTSTEIQDYASKRISFTGDIKILRNAERFRFYGTNFTTSAGEVRYQIQLILPQALAAQEIQVIREAPNHGKTYI